MVGRRESGLREAGIAAAELCARVAYDGRNVPSPREMCAWLVHEGLAAVDAGGLLRPTDLCVELAAFAP